MLLKKGGADVTTRGVAAVDGARGQAIASLARLGAASPCWPGVQLVTLEATASGQSQTLPLQETITEPFISSATVVVGWNRYERKKGLEGYRNGYHRAREVTVG